MAIEFRGMTELAANDKKIGKLTAYPKWCKGCGICVGFCPTNTLVLENGKMRIAQPELCIKCRICEKLCPDYAVYFTEEDVTGDV